MLAGKTMSYDYQKLYDALGDSGVAPYVANILNTTTFRLVTGTASIDPFRGSGPGRADDASRFHIYTSDQILVCSGEVVGSGARPPHTPSPRHAQGQPDPALAKATS